MNVLFVLHRQTTMKLFQRPHMMYKSLIFQLYWLLSHLYGLGRNTTENPRGEFFFLCNYIKVMFHFEITHWYPQSRRFMVFFIIAAIYSSSMNLTVLDKGVRVFSMCPITATYSCKNPTELSYDKFNLVRIRYGHSFLPGPIIKCRNY